MSNNINHIRGEIMKKLDYNKPYYADYNAINGVMGDFDQFPYKRYFRGQYNSPSPTVIERECSWRPRENNCYKEIVTSVPNTPNYCWEYPCSSVGPCKPKQEMTTENKEEPSRATCSKNYIISP